LLKSFQNIAVPIGVFNATIVFIHAENTQHWISWAPRVFPQYDWD
jgi:hypothetical protein